MKHHPLRIYLDETGESLREFADRAGTSYAQLSRVINGESDGSVALMRRILMASNGKISATDLLGEGEAA